MKSGVRKADLPPKPVVLAALSKAIDAMDHMRPRLWMKQYCETVQPLRESFEKGLLVPDKDVIRYHAGSDSEDGKSMKRKAKRARRKIPQFDLSHSAMRI